MGANFCSAMDDIDQSTSTTRGGGGEKSDWGARQGNTPTPKYRSEARSHSPYPLPLLSVATFIRSSEKHPRSFTLKTILSEEQAKLVKRATPIYEITPEESQVMR
ncbi:hypothetical protein NPIL_276191 [Nephila pilipes]|uniref:Uncharacterized protein n=1 Tax=Nephila pilipes TaxID=299642 RepID=A0A8X6PY98_NEPPI|nr:hypothetical protein NPIL_276191 [Nephila pilipes]